MINFKNLSDRITFSGICTVAFLFLLILFDVCILKNDFNLDAKIQSASIFYGVVFYITGIKVNNEEQFERSCRESWLVINSSYGQESSSGRIKALEDLKKSKISLNGLCLKKAYLKGINLECAKLDYVNFQEARLVDAKFNHAHLQEADFTNANLGRATFYHSKLLNANFKNAELKNAEFKNAHLQNVNFSGANLRDSKLREADLRGADLRQAVLSGADLIDAKNLDKANVEMAIYNDFTKFPKYFKDKKLTLVMLKENNLNDII